MEKKVTIVISHLNDNENLYNCLINISKKSFAKELKVLVQDGLSVISPLVTLADISFPMDLKVLIEKDHGIYDAWNKAISNIDTKYVSFLGADDRITEDWFKQVDVAEASSANFVSGRALMKKDTNLLLLGDKTHKLLWPMSMNVVHSAGLFSTNFIKNNKFDTTKVVAADYIYLLSHSKMLRHSFFDKVVVVMDGYGISQRKGEIGVAEISNYLRETTFLRFIIYRIKQSLRQLKK
jgi:glycosyltransferase involved in cell wall biosynthesis